MKLGINSYTYMWSIGFQGVNPAYPERAARPKSPLKPLDLLQKARDLGVHLVQTGPNLLLEQYSEADIEKFIQTAKSSDIVLELGTSGLDYDHLVNQVALAKRMGASLIRSLPEINSQYVTDARQLLPSVLLILPTLEREGVRLAIENGKIPAFNLRSVMHEIHSPFVGIVLDLANSWQCLRAGKKLPGHWLLIQCACTTRISRSNASGIIWALFAKVLLPGRGRLK